MMAVLGAIAAASAFVASADCPPGVQKVPEPDVSAILSVADRAVADEFARQARFSSIRCQPLGVGQARVVDAPDSRSPTGLSARYKLTRLSDKEYEVKVNPYFVDRRSSPVPQGALNEGFRKRVQGCFDFANRAMFGPDGQRLRLALAQPGQDMIEVPQVEIGVYPAKGGTVARQTASQYREDISCPTLIHETMHLLGLCDEYEEKWTGKRVDASGNILEPTDGSSKYRFDCRAVGPRDSIMNDQNKAFASLMFGGRPFIYRCACSTKACQAVLSKWSPHAGDCPRDAKMLGGRLADLEELGRSSGATRIDASTVEFVTSGDRFGIRRSLLYSAQFNAIVHPGCAVNEDFYACSHFAYSDAKGPNRKGCGDRRRRSMPDPAGKSISCPECDRGPAACSQPDWVGEVLQPPK